MKIFFVKAITVILVVAMAFGVLSCAKSPNANLIKEYEDTVKKIEAQIQIDELDGMGALSALFELAAFEEKLNKADLTNAEQAKVDKINKKVEALIKD